MMMILFDEEQIAKNHDESIRREERGKAKFEVEIDFITQRDGKLIPIDVKFADNTRVKSLNVYMKTYKPAYAIKPLRQTLHLRTMKRLCHTMHLSVFEIHCCT